MSILVSEILTIVNNVLFPSGLNAETDIDLKLRIVLKDITDRADFLTYVGTLTATASVAWIAYPSDMRPGSMPIITVDTEEPLDYITPEAYYEELAADNATGTPEYFTKMGGVLYFYKTWSTAAAALANTIHYGRIHPDAVTTIYLGEPFRKAIQSGVLAEVAEAHNRFNEAKYFRDKYEYEVAKRLADLEPRAHVVAYYDL